MNFGNNLKNFRKSKNISQEELADKVGVTRQSVSKWENGDAYPEMSNIVALCKIFHCKITDLINENITDTASFDDGTLDEVVKFKKNQQKHMKILSKIIYIIAHVCQIILAIPTCMLVLLTIVFPFISSNVKITDSSIQIFKEEIPLSIEKEIITIDNNKIYVNTKTDLKKFLNNHNQFYINFCIEYILISLSILSLLTVYFLYSLYKLYKNMYSDDTPFNINNEAIVNKLVIAYVCEFILMKLTALIFMAFTQIDLDIDLNFKDIISILVILSLIYLFKYGRMIQVDSKQRLYENENV